MLTIISGLSSFGKSIILDALKVKGVKVLNEYVSNIDKGITQDLQEEDKVDQIINNSLWFKEGEEWAVSLISVLLKRLPLDKNYNIVFIEREIEEIIAGKENIFSNIIGDNINAIQEDLKEAFIETHSRKIKIWLNQNPNFNTIYVDYNTLLEKPIETINRICSGLKTNSDMRSEFLSARKSGD